MRNRVVLAAALAMSLLYPGGSARAQVEGDTPIEGELVRPDGSLLRGPPVLPRSADPSAAIALLEPRAAAESRPGAITLQLAEQLAARSHTWRLAALAALTDADLAMTQGDARARARADEVARRAGAAADGDRARAIELLARIVAPAAESVRVGALALRAQLLVEAGRGPEAERDASSLIALDPHAPEAAHAHLLLAERAFAAADMPGAIARYEAALAVPGVAADVRAYAHYKLGWCRINLADFAAALADFEACRRAALRDPVRGATLAREAARDSLRAIEGMRLGAREAVPRVASLTSTPSERASLMSRYAAMLRDAGRAADAAEVEREWARIANE